MRPFPVGYAHSTAQYYSSIALSVAYFTLGGRHRTGMILHAALDVPSHYATVPSRLPLWVKGGASGMAAFSLNRDSPDDREPVWRSFGDPGWIRTSDLQLRRLL